MNEKKIEELENTILKAKQQIEELKKVEFELPIFFRSYNDYTEGTFVTLDIGTNEDAKTLEKLIINKKTYAKLKYRYIADKLNDGWTPDWNDSEQKKYFNCYEDKWYQRFYISSERIDVHFKSAELAKKAREIMGDDMDYLKGE